MRPVPDNPYLPAPRTKLQRPYQNTGRHLHLPAALPQAVTAAFAWAADAWQEAGALLYGVRGSQLGDVDVVHALVIPAQVGHRTHYRIPPESIAEASALTRNHGWVTLGQIHSHPAEDVEHSWYDDRRVISTRAVSFVLPNYGRDTCDWLARVGVHDYQDGWWHQLTAEQVMARVSFAGAPLQVLDLHTQAARTI